MELLLQHTGATARWCFLEAKAGVNDMTALHCAARAGRLECTRLLLLAGADTTATDRNGMLALEVAEREGHSAVATLLHDPPPTRAQELCRSRQRLAFASGFLRLPICYDLLASICEGLPPHSKAVTAAAGKWTCKR